MQRFFRVAALAAVHPFTFAVGLAGFTFVAMLAAGMLDASWASVLVLASTPAAVDVKTLLESIATGVTKLKSDTHAELQALKSDIERVEGRHNVQGLVSDSAGASKKSGGPSKLIDTATGRPLVEIKAGDDIAARYRAAGFMGSEDFSELQMGDFVRAIAGQKTTDLARKALSVGTDSAGGFTVPGVLMPEILNALVAASSLMQAGSRIVPVGAPGEGGKSYTIAAVNTVPQAAWRTESGAVTESDPTFRAVVAVPRSLAFYFKVSRELLADAGNLERVLPTIIGQSRAVAMDRAGLIGSGTAPEPRGIRNVAGIQPVPNGANGASLATVRWANLMTAVQAILSANGPMPTAAIMAPRTLVGFGSLVDTTNQPLQRPQMLDAMRMVATSQLPVNLTVGSSSDCSEIYVGSFDRTAFVMREAVSIQRLNEAFATTGEVGFMCHVRTDFIVEYPALLALVTGVRP
jgi:HK97 family phage major capsid protein